MSKAPMTLKPAQAQALYRLLSANGMDCSKLKSDNPFSPEFDIDIYSTGPGSFAECKKDKGGFMGMGRGDYKKTIC